MSGFALSVEGLQVRSCEPGVAPLVRDVGFHLRLGRCLALIGETGSGKSLVAQALFGLLPAGLRAEGGVSLNGGAQIDLADRGGLRALWATAMFLIPQEPTRALNPTMTVGPQIAEMFPHLLNGQRQARIRDALAHVDLAPDVAGRYPAALSGGMNQRVLAAIAASAPAQVIVADEPTKGLDSQRVRQVTDLLAGLMGAGKSLAVITHDVGVARRLDGEVAVMRDGRIVEQGPAAAILDQPRHPYARAYMAALPARWAPPPASVEATDRPAVAARSLRFGYPGRPALFEGLDLAARPGRVLAVVGPSGVGKSTLGDILLGRRKPEAGGVRWGDLDPYACPASALRRLRPRHQKLFQDPTGSFAPHRRLRHAFEDLRLIQPALDLTTRLPALLDRLKLTAALLERYPDEVSGGEAQRLALARILLLDPVFLVADEPTSRLDPIVQAETIGLLREIVAESDLALLLISHDRALVRAVADDVVDLGEGAPTMRGCGEGA
ncbi:MAG: ABC transporter ATP-binding protein [Elsteraceae bacterium]